MKTITITIDNTLEQELTNLSESEGRDISDVAVSVLSEKLSEKARRVQALQALDLVFSDKTPAPFDQLSEADVMELVDKEVQAVRQAQ